MQASSLSSYLSVSYTDKHLFNISGENKSLDRPNQVFQQKKITLNHPYFNLFKSYLYKSV